MPRTFLGGMVPALLWAILILVLLLMPGRAIPGSGWLARFHVDKLVHAFLFGVFFLLLFKGLRRQNDPPALQRRTLYIALALSVVYGVSTELLQEATPFGRHAEWSDVVADTIGSLLGVAYVLFIGKWLNSLAKRERNRSNMAGNAREH